MLTFNELQRIIDCYSLPQNFYIAVREHAYKAIYFVHIAYWSISLTSPVNADPVLYFSHSFPIRPEENYNFEEIHQMIDAGIEGLKQMADLHGKNSIDLLAGEDDEKEKT